MCAPIDDARLILNLSHVSQIVRCFTDEWREVRREVCEESGGPMSDEGFYVGNQTNALTLSTAEKEAL